MLISWEYPVVPRGQFVLLPCGKKMGFPLRTLVPHFLSPPSSVLPEGFPVWLAILGPCRPHLPSLLIHPLWTCPRAQSCQPGGLPATRDGNPQRGCQRPGADTEAGADIHSLCRGGSGAIAICRKWLLGEGSRLLGDACQAP